MLTSNIQPLPRTAAFRIFGATFTLLAILVIALLAVRPEMMMAVIHSAMKLIFVP